MDLLSPCRYSHPRSPPRQAVSGKAPAGMGLIDQDALLDRRVLVHDGFDLIDIGIEYPYAGQVGSIGDGVYYGQQSSGPEKEVPPACSQMIFSAPGRLWSMMQS